LLTLCTLFSTSGPMLSSVSACLITFQSYNVSQNDWLLGKEENLSDWLNSEISVIFLETTSAMECYLYTYDTLKCFWFFS